jgi:hypothetical protein
VVTTEDLQAERLTDEELFELAYPSVSPDHYCIRSIEQALGGVMGEEIAADLTADLPHGTIFVVSNKDGLDGASVLASPEAMQLIQAHLGGGELIIIPSSVHEILVLRREDAPSVPDLNQVIREVNQAEVAEKARLADHAFSFNSRLSIARDEALSQDQECFITRTFLKKIRKIVGPLRSKPKALPLSSPLLSVFLWKSTLFPMSLHGPAARVSKS